MIGRLMRVTLGRYVRDEAGAAAYEYALMVLILGGCAATALHAIGA